VSTDVLVVGAGPTGLTTALQAHLHGARVRVVERRPTGDRPSRAMVVHSRTLEVLRPLGVAAAVLERGDRAPRAVLHLGRREVTTQLGEAALRDTAFPHLTLVPQAAVEAVLTDALVDLGVAVERGVELVAVTPSEGRASATLVREGDRETACARWVVGCDGADSTVRRCTGTGWHGGAYREEVVLADVELDGRLAPEALHVVAARQGVVFLFALGEGATWRLLATRPVRPGAGSFGQPGEEVPAAEVRALLPSSRLGATVREVGWSARVTLQHRLADDFGAGPLFLAGDAAHAHSPAAAQGMNTGIVDAVNLGWKLGLAAGHPAGAGSLLASYDAERRPAARQVLALTHAVFFAEASANPVASLLRGTVVPLAAPALPIALRSRTLMAVVVRLLSQGWVRYRDSTLSVEDVRGGPGPRPGDRLPDERVSCDGRRVDLHELTASPGVHVLLASLADARAAGLPEAPYVTVHRIDSWPGRGVVAVRPDGHVGFRSGELDPDALHGWLELVAAL
jgi:2-polyprenyl-6-methoxyphenol hydroxylase-like FAD-dependent oxidoreductase